MSEKWNTKNVTGGSVFHWCSTSIEHMVKMILGFHSPPGAHTVRLNIPGFHEFTVKFSRTHCTIKNLEATVLHSSASYRAASLCHHNIKTSEIASKIS